MRPPRLAYGLKDLVVRVPEARAYAAVLDAPNEAEAGGAGGVWGGSASAACMACRGRGDPVVVVRPPDEGWMEEERVGERGLLLGDLQVGGVSVLASGFVVRIGGRDGNNMGRIFLDLELPLGWARGDEEWVAGTRQKSRPDAGFPLVTFENEPLAGEPPFSFQAPPDASQQGKNVRALAVQNSFR